jgi:sugar (pentulose or hexulose) kinase
VSSVGLPVVAAVDLGASSGRVLAVDVAPDHLTATEVHRFANLPVEASGRLQWDVLALFRGMLEGLSAAGARHDVASIGIDSWAIDYALLDASGALLGNPMHYRDASTDGVAARVAAERGADAIFAATGVALLPFNTVYQLIATKHAPQRALARTLLLVPDLLAYWLTGECAVELTNASTTQLLDVTSRTWSPAMLDLAGLPSSVLPKLLEPGQVIGGVRASVAADLGIAASTPVVAVGSHDTASAVVATPMTGAESAYISSGTWSLVGVELEAPVISPGARQARFTNELGVDGTVRFLRNVMGLWPLQELVRGHRARGEAVSLDELLEAAANEPGLRSVVDADDEVFLPPGDMSARLRAWCERSGQPVPESLAQLARCILDSLAIAHARAVRAAEQLSGRAVRVVHMVGGGSRNALLCQLTADACGVPVVAGPVEASALGNALVQARAIGAIHGGLAELRDLVRSTQHMAHFEPRADQARWAAAEARLSS